MFRSLFILVLFYSVSFSSYAAPLSASEKVIAVKYMSSKAFPESVKACAEITPTETELYKATLDEWLFANNEAISRGKEILNIVLHQDGNKESEDEFISRYLEKLKMEFSTLSESQKTERCRYILDVMKTEQ